MVGAGVRCQTHFCFRCGERLSHLNPYVVSRFPSFATRAEDLLVAMPDMCTTPLHRCLVVSPFDLLMGNARANPAAHPDNKLFDFVPGNEPPPEEWLDIIGLDA